MGFIGQFLLFWSSLIIYSTGWIAGIVGCLALFIICFAGMSSNATKIRKLMPKDELNKLLNSSFIKKMKIISNSIGVPMVILLILAIYTRNEIIALLSFLFCLAFAGFQIFSVFHKPKKLN